MINNSSNEHSHLYTSPLKYFEYIYGGLQVLAVDFPAHRALPFNQYINFFDEGDPESFFDSLNNLENSQSLNNDELDSITLNTRVKKIIEFLN